jgi:ribosomal protein S18 acetylase RimI-like enzyme
MLITQSTQLEKKTHDYRIRSAKPADRSDVVRVIDRVTAERRYLQTDCFEPDKRWEILLGSPFNLQAGYLLRILEDQGKVGGFCRLFPDEIVCPRGSIGNIGIVLLPEYRSRGLGTRLLSSLLDIAAQAGYVELRAEILASNLPSIGLFHKFGFHRLFTRKVGLSYLPYPVNEVVVSRLT